MKKERKSMSGLFKRNGVWRIDKVVDGERIYENCQTHSRAEAERQLVYRLEQIRQKKIYGVRATRVFREAAIKFLEENRHKKSLHKDAAALKYLDPFIGDLRLEAVHMGSLQAYIDQRCKEGVKNRTINGGLEITRHILKLAASAWRDEQGLTWLQSAPYIKLRDEKVDARPPYPLSWEEQKRLFEHLPTHLKAMADFIVNTGCRDKEVCRLRWEWEVRLPELSTSVFIIPGEVVKNTDDRLVILNDKAREIIEEKRGEHETYVFTFQGHPISRMLNSAWKRARRRAGLAVRVHDLKHTFGRRLRAVNVSYEDRQDLLGHRSGRITTHYSPSEVSNLIAAANKVCQCSHSNTPLFTLLRRKSKGVEMQSVSNV